MRKTIGRSFVVGLAALFGASCGHSARQASDSTRREPAPWSYAGVTGPAHWDKLDPEYANCGFGTTQSPVDISNPQPEDLPNIVFHYAPTHWTIRNTGHTVQVDLAPGNSIDVADESYELIQILFHAPSEHSMLHRLADAELHLVHRNAAGQLAIIAILLRNGREDTALRDVWNNLPPAPGPEKTMEGTLDLEKILPEDRRTFRYDGSQTTPPCAEVVTWLVMREAMTAGASQLAGFTTIFAANNRPVQALNHRTIFEDTSRNR